MCAHIGVDQLVDHWDQCLLYSASALCAGSVAFSCGTFAARSSHLRLRRYLFYLI
jgi:hypothetical protein